MPKYRKFHVKATESWDINDMPDDFTRLLWVMLPLGLCREGRGVDNSAWIKSKIFPLRLDVTAEMITTAMNWYVDRGMVERYEVGRRKFFYIPTWHDYQGTTIKEADSIYPAPPQEKINEQSGACPELVPSKSGTDSVFSTQYSDADSTPPSGVVSPEQERQADIESFHNGDVPETKPREPPKPVKIDVIDHIVQQAKRRDNGEIEWLLPGTLCGDHDYLAPYQTFCDVLGRDPSTVGGPKTLKWLNQFARMAIVSPGDNGSDAIVIPPAVMAQAIKSIRDDWSFKNKKWRTPYSSGFAELVELTASQIECGALESEAPSASKALSDAGYDPEAIKQWAKTQ